MAAHIQTVIKDNLGKQFDPNSLPHSYTYDANGNRLTDTCVEAGSITRVKTYTYVQSGTVWVVQTESAWINENE